MDNIIGADAAKLAGLQIDLLAKIRSKQVTLEHLEWFVRITRAERDRFSGIDRESRILCIDRTLPFGSVNGFLDAGWSIYEQDDRSLGLTQIDLAKVQLVSMSDQNDGSWTTVKDRIARLKDTPYVRLDAKIFQTLWENQSLIPNSWKEKTNGNVTCIFFDGTILTDPAGNPAVLCLYRDGGRWASRAYPFYSVCAVGSLSAVLAKI